MSDKKNRLFVFCWITLETCWGVWRWWVWGDFVADNNKQNFSHHSWYSTGLGNEIINDGFDGAIIENIFFNEISFFLFTIYF